MADMNMSTEPCMSLERCKMVAYSPAYERHLLQFELNFEVCDTFIWMTNYWKLCYIFIGFYLVAIFTGQHCMKSRKPFQLRGLLFVWNASLALVSIFQAWRMVTAVFYYINLVGWHQTACGPDASKQYLQSVSRHMWIFALLKFVELGDTVFIVLRKTPLIFLHWFHHATVCFFVWSSGAYPSAFFALFVAMNCFVHSIMYSYYTLKVLRVRVPKPISMAITSLQLFQMLGGVAITLYVNYSKSTPGLGCCVYDEAINIALSIYFAYFVLFSQYFVRAYLSKKPGHVRKALHEKPE